ncbi:YaiI/YqxD family protein [Paraliobacillus sp. JSM ZJ581]|uniref:YaiI/YqxD family protein n=1 Tax=Paraliobacillus sp. JSM ZJ581 TaxID=3342118 RepID=UPI0035A94DA3
MKIYVDADACPVKEIIIQVAIPKNILVYLVKSYAHFSTHPDPEGVISIYVDSEREAVDYRILSMLRAGDLVITQDYGLASLALEKKAFALHHKGLIYTADNIDYLLEVRYQHAQARKKKIRTKGPKRLTQEDKDKFKATLIGILTNFQ